MFIKQNLARENTESQRTIWFSGNLQARFAWGIAVNTVPWGTIPLAQKPYKKTKGKAILDLAVWWNQRGKELERVREKREMEL